MADQNRGKNDLALALEREWWAEDVQVKTDGIHVRTSGAPQLKSVCDVIEGMELERGAVVLKGMLQSWELTSSSA